MFTSLMWGLLIAGCIALSSAQEFGDYYPSARTMNLRRLNGLANQVDRFVQVPRGFWDGSAIRKKSQYDLAQEMGEAIGVRGNFDDLNTPSKPAVPTSDIATRRMPMTVMEDSEFGSPIAPTQWQMMLAPFVTLMPDVSEFCQCKGMANCGCCGGIFIKPLAIRNNVCMNVSMTRDAYSSSQYMLHNRLYFDTYKILDVSVSEKQSPMACVSVLPFSTVAGCIQLVDIHWDPQEEKMCNCMAISLQFKDRPVISLPSGCTCFGKPVPNNRKRGLFGLDFNSLFGSMQMLFG